MSTRSGRHAVVLGAGPGGLTGVMILVRRGRRVTVLEAADRIGARNGALRPSGFVFDVGSTFPMLEDIRDPVFHEAGATMADRLDCPARDPMCRLPFAGRMNYLRPRNRFEELDHCHPVGGGTHPGSGLPTICESGRIAANRIRHRDELPFASGNLEVQP